MLSAAGLGVGTLGHGHNPGTRVGFRLGHRLTNASRTSASRRIGIAVCLTSDVVSAERWYGTHGPTTRW
jgi:hypothetical protein